MEATITTLINNVSARGDVEAEHGLSLYITCGETTLLFDTGASDKLIRNAEILNVDLSKVDTMVISHGHYDHTGGIRPFFEKYNQPVKVFAGRSFSSVQYHREEDGCLSYIGSTTDERWFMRHGISFRITDLKKYRLNENMWLCTAFTQNTDFEPYYPESEHEVALVIRTSNGSAAICGCSHIGVVNICSEIEARFNERLYAFIGGAHLKSADERRVARTAEWFKRSEIKLLCACHCSGAAQMEVFKETLPMFSNNLAGMTVKI